VDIVDVYCTGLCLSEDDRAARIRIAADERAVGDRDIRGAKNNDSTNDVEIRGLHVVRQYNDAVVDQFHVAGRLDMNPCPDAERKVLAIWISTDCSSLLPVGGCFGRRKGREPLNNQQSATFQNLRSIQKDFKILEI
jgi:hypothetical protein